VNILVVTKCFGPEGSSVAGLIKNNFLVFAKQIK
jgi:hypothetical protein